MRRLGIIFFVLGSVLILIGVLWIPLNPWGMGKDAPLWVKCFPARVGFTGLGFFALGLLFLWIRDAKATVLREEKHDL